MKTSKTSWWNKVPQEGKNYIFCVCVCVYEYFKDPRDKAV